MQQVLHMRMLAGCAAITLHPALSSSLALAVDDGRGSSTCGGVLDCIIPKHPNKDIFGSADAVAVRRNCNTTARCAEMHLSVAISRRCLTDACRLISHSCLLFQSTGDSNAVVLCAGRGTACPALGQTKHPTAMALGPAQPSPAPTD